MGSLNAFEQEWKKCAPGETLTPTRVERFDWSSELFWAPLEYRRHQIASTPAPDVGLAALQAEFEKFVLGEFGSTSSRGPPPPRPVTRPHAVVGFDFARQLLARTEQELVYGGVVDVAARKAGPDTADRLRAVLGHRLVGNTTNVENLGSPEFEEAVGKLAGSRLPIRMVMPSFPFKDQCPFRTGAPASEPDAGELYLLIRLHALALAVFQVYPFGGSSWILASDGHAYADILGVSRDEVTRYVAGLRDWRDDLNIQGTISIIDLAETASRLLDPKTGGEAFQPAAAEVLEGLRRLQSQHARGFQQQLAVLVRGMKWNICFKSLLQGIDWADHWNLLSAEDPGLIDHSLREKWELVNSETEDRSLRYAAFNMTVSRLRLFPRAFPDVLRATVHDKPNQVAAPRIGDVYPWNGVPVVSGNSARPTIKTTPLYKLLREHTDVTEVRLHEGGTPFFYQDAAQATVVGSPPP